MTAATCCLWHEVTKIQHFWLEVNAMAWPVQVREREVSYGRGS